MRAYSKPCSYDWWPSPQLPLPGLCDLTKRIAEFLPRPVRKKLAVDLREQMLGAIGGLRALCGELDDSSTSLPHSPDRGDEPLLDQGVDDRVQTLHLDAGPPGKFAERDPRCRTEMTQQAEPAQRKPEALQLGLDTLFNRTRLNDHRQRGIKCGLLRQAVRLDHTRPLSLRRSLNRTETYSQTVRSHSRSLLKQGSLLEPKDRPKSEDHQGSLRHADRPK